MEQKIQQNVGRFSFGKYLSQIFRIKGDEIYYSKNTRKNFKNTIFISIFIIIAFLLSFVIAIATAGYDITFLFRSLFGFRDFIKEWLVAASILGVSGLAFLFAHKSGLFNIGISGQMIAAGLAISSLSKTLVASGVELNKGFVVLAIIVAMLTGAFVSLISGLLKNFFNIHEVVSAIMINWIIFFLAKYFIVGTSGLGAGSLSGENGNGLVIHEALSLYTSKMDSGVIGSFTLFIILVIGIFIVFKFTSYGKKITSIGKSLSAGVYSGYHTKTLQLSSFVISGAIAGILAMIVYTGNTSTRNIPAELTLGNMLPVEGFNGIAIALVSFSNPIVIVIISLLFAMVQFANGYPTGLNELILSLSMYAIAIFVIIYRVQPILWIKKQLRKRGNTSYFVNGYDDDRTKLKNDIRKKIADRNIDIFLIKQKSNHLGFFEKRIAIMKETFAINQEYINYVKKAKYNCSTLHKIPIEDDNLSEGAK